MASLLLLHGRPPPPALLLLLYLSILVMACGEDPKPTPWPEAFHARCFVNLTAKGGTLQINELWYDWPRRRNLNLIGYQLDDEPLHDVEWNNGTSFYYTLGAAGSCRVRKFPVGVLPPDWLAGATYLGKEITGGFECHVFTKVDFIWYYEDVITGRPVRWDFFDGMKMWVMTFEVGAVLDDNYWQAPPYCFHNDSAGDLPKTESQPSPAANMLDYFRLLSTNLASNQHPTPF